MESSKNIIPLVGSRCSARIENRTRSAVKSRAILLGVSCSKAGKKWTPEEDNILRKFYSKELNKTAYRLPGRSEVSVSIRAKILGVRPIAASKTQWTPQEDQIMKKYYSMEGFSIIKRLKNRTKNAVANRDRRIGVCKYNQPN